MRTESRLARAFRARIEAANLTTEELDRIRAKVALAKEAFAKFTKVYEHGTGRLLAELSGEDRISRWCEVRGYLPHHKVSGGWVVIK